MKKETFLEGFFFNIKPGGGGVFRVMSTELINMNETHPRAYSRNLILKLNQFLLNDN